MGGREGAREGGRERERKRGRGRSDEATDKKNNKTKCGSAFPIAFLCIVRGPNAMSERGKLAPACSVAGLARGQGFINADAVQLWDLCQPGMWMRCAHPSQSTSTRQGCVSVLLKFPPPALSASCFFAYCRHVVSNTAPLPVVLRSKARCLTQLHCWFPRPNA